MNINMDLYKWIYLMGSLILLVFHRLCVFSVYFTFKLYSNIYSKYTRFKTVA